MFHGRKSSTFDCVLRVLIEKSKWISLNFQGNFRNSLSLFFKLSLPTNVNCLDWVKFINQIHWKPDFLFCYLFIYAFTCVATAILVETKTVFLLFLFDFTIVHFWCVYEAPPLQQTAQSAIFWTYSAAFLAIESFIDLINLRLFCLIFILKFFIIFLFTKTIQMNHRRCKQSAGEEFPLIKFHIKITVNRI